MSENLRIKSQGDLQSILNIFTAILFKEDNKISWNGDKLDDLTFDLIYVLKFQPEVQDHIKDAAIWSVINDCARANDFSQDFFIRKLRDYIINSNARSKRRYTGLTQLNCTCSTNIPSTLTSISGIVNFSANLSPSESAAISKLSSFEKDRMGFDPDFYYISIPVQAEDEYEALEDVYKNTKYMLGIMNFYYRGYGISKRFGFPSAPIGKFLTASAILIVDKKKKLTGSVQYNSGYPHLYSSSFRVWQKLDNGISVGAKHHISSIRQSDFGERVVKAIIAFQEGLEDNDIDNALLKFWTGIELLCSRDSKEAANRTIERASSIFAKRDHAERRMIFIQNYRNKIVHKRDSGKHALLCAQWASIYLAEIIRFYLFNNHRMKSYSDIIDYMSLPSSEQKLREEIKLRRMRLDSIARQKAKATT